MVAEYIDVSYISFSFLILYQFSDPWEEEKEYFTGKTAFKVVLNALHDWEKKNAHFIVAV